MSALDEYASVRDKAQALVGSSAVTLENIIPLLADLMVFAEHLPNLSGAQKKELVVTALADVIGQSATDPQLKTTLLLVLRSGVMGDVVDLVVDASRGNLDLNKTTCGRRLLCVGRLFCCPWKCTCNSPCCKT